MGAFFGALTVGFGAFGAHALSDRLVGESLDWWRTAVLYQGLHALALCLVGLLEALGFRARTSRIVFTLGILIFSGTLYAMALGGPRWLGAITPIGGTLLIVGWIALGLSARRISAGGAQGGSEIAGPDSRRASN